MDYCMQIMKNMYIWGLYILSTYLLIFSSIFKKSRSDRWRVMTSRGKPQSEEFSFFQGCRFVYVWFNFFLFDFFILINFSFQLPRNVPSGHAHHWFYLHHYLKVKKWSSESPTSSNYCCSPWLCISSTSINNTCLVKQAYDMVTKFAPKEKVIEQLQWRLS